jgi:hypothetical protein
MEIARIGESELILEYKDAIAAAAREYVIACRAYRLDRTVALQEAVAKAYDKLSWMVAAEDNGWEPLEFEPEQ